MIPDSKPPSEEKDMSKAHLLDPWFHVCAAEAIKTPGFVKELERLYGFNAAKDPATLAALLKELVYDRLERAEVSR